MGLVTGGTYQAPTNLTATLPRSSHVCIGRASHALPVMILTPRCAALSSQCGHWMAPPYPLPSRGPYPVTRRPASADNLCAVPPGGGGWVRDPPSMPARDAI
eukprot:103949-Pleurochrysis_carterae.AAC.1